MKKYILSLIFIFDSSRYMAQSAEDDMAMMEAMFMASAESEKWIKLGKHVLII